MTAPKRNALPICHPTLAKSQAGRAYVGNVSSGPQTGAQIPDGSLTLSPSPSRLVRLRRETVPSGFAWAIANAAFGTALAMRMGLRLALVVEGLVVLLTAAAVIVSRSTESRVMVFCSTTSLGQRGRFGGIRSYPRSEVGLVYAVHLRSPRLGSRQVLLVTSRAGKTLMTMIEDAWIVVLVVLGYSPGPSVR